MNNSKKNAALKAVDFILPGMVVGLGTGSTARFAVEEVARRMKEGTIGELKFVASSLRTERLALENGIEITPMGEFSEIDINIDGADEVDTELNLIKGGGGALLREKVIAQCSRRNIVIVDDSKLSSRLGTIHPLPVEVFPFAFSSAVKFLETLGSRVSPRILSNGSFYRTDQDNYVLDCDFGGIQDPGQLAGLIDARAGIACHGMFLGTTTEVIIGTENGYRLITG